MKNVYQRLWTLLLLSAFLWAGTGVNAQSCYSNYQYYRVFTINNPNGTPLLDFQVNLSVDTQTPISNGRMNVDASDMRFTNSYCCDPIPYYIESGVNTTTTSVWIRVDSIPAGGSVDVTMIYGNSGATDASDPAAVFDLWDDFDGPTNVFGVTCGTTTPTYNAGTLQLSWSSSGMILSDSVFPQSNVYTAEMDVTAASGSWPGLYWSKTNTSQSYALLINSSQARVSKSGSATGNYCTGHNWASTLITYSSVVGMWSNTWVATGDIRTSFPSIGPILSTDTQHPRDSDMRLGIGGISSGTGSMTMDWVRVRKWAASAPTASAGAESMLSATAAFDLGADTTICAGNSITFNGPSGNDNYVWSTGDTTSSITVSAGGSYSLYSYNAGTCPASDTVDLGINNPIQVMLGADTSICDVDMITLDAGSGFNSYAWNTGGSAQTEMAGPGTYSVDVIDSNGCSSSDTIMVMGLTTPMPSLGGNVDLCDGNMLTLDAGTGDSYMWSTGDTTQTIMVSGSGTYGVTVMNSNGCSGMDYAVVTVSALPAPAFTWSAVLLDASFTDGSTGGTSWSWDFGDGNTSTVQNPTHTYTAAGTYYVCLTVSSAPGCDTTVCDSVNVIAIGIDDALSANDLSLRPVPAHDFLEVGFAANLSRDLRLEVVDLQGRILQLATVPAGSSQLRLDTRGLAAGMYLLRFESEQGHGVKRFIVE